jgi:hypothetical protein
VARSGGGLATGVDKRSRGKRGGGVHVRQMTKNKGMGGGGKGGGCDSDGGRFEPSAPAGSGPRLVGVGGHAAWMVRIGEAGGCLVGPQHSPGRRRLNSI